MRRVSRLLSLTRPLILVGCPRPSPPRPRSRPSKQYTIEQFMDDDVAISGASFSADETQLLFSSNRTGIFNVYTVPGRRRRRRRP